MSPFSAEARKYFIHAAHRAVGVSSATAALKACDPARFAPAELSEERLDVALFAARGEEPASSSLTLVSRYLRQRLDARCVWPGDEPIAADVAVLLGDADALGERLLKHVERHCAEGGGVAALGITPARHELDRRFQWDVLGAELGETPVGPIAWLELDPGGAGHPIVGGMAQGDSPIFAARKSGQSPSYSWAEGDSPIFAARKSGQSPSHSCAAPCASVLRLADDAQVLLLVRRGERTEPAAWVRRHALGRVFSTTLRPGEATSGEAFLRLVAAAVAWTAGRELPLD